MSEKFWKVAEVAAALRLDRQTVYDWIRTGKLKAVKIGQRVVRIPDSEMIRLLAAVMP